MPGCGKRPCRPRIASLTTRLSDVSAVRAQAGRIALLVVLHLAALAILLLTESRPVPQLAFLLSWAFFNFCWIVLFGRPAVAAAMSLAWLVLLILLSQFKHDVLLMTVNFVDLMVIDADTVSFLVKVFPSLDAKVGMAMVLLLVALILTWYFDPLRMRRSIAALGAAACFAGLVGLALAFPSDPWEEFYAENYFSKFTRSGVTAIGDLVTRGVLESDAKVSEGLAAAADKPCTVTKPPHIVMVFDESSFDARAIPGIKLPPGYGAHFKSSDGAQRSLMVEGAGGPSWYTEYNVLTGLSARSYGRFAEFVTRIAAGRVERGSAEHAAPLRLQDIHALSDVRRVLERAAFSDHRRYPELPRLHGAQRELPRPGLVLFRQGGGDDREAARQGPAVPAGLHGAEPLSLGLPLPSRSRARMARSRQPAGRRRIPAAPAHECGGLSGIRRAAEEGFSRRVHS